MTLRKLLLLMLASLWSVTALADAITYSVTVNTSSIVGTNGSLDFQFNPGINTTQSASIEILGFTGGTLGSATTTGDVLGTLPGTVTIDNGTIFNDYFTGYTFGNALSFDVSFLGPALTAPDGTSTSGSSFAFSMFSDPGGTLPVLTSDPNGFAVTVGVNLDGSTTASTASTQTNVAATPEPGSLLLLSSALLASFGWTRSKIRTREEPT